MGIKVDEWGNVWDANDHEHKRPVQPHPELETAKQKCGCGEFFVFRARSPQGAFEWRCACDRVYPGLHH